MEPETEHGSLHVMGELFGLVWFGLSVLRVISSDKASFFGGTTCETHFNREPVHDLMRKECN